LAPCEIKSSTKDGSSWSSSTAIVQNAWAPDLIWNSGAGKFYLAWEEYPIGGGDPDLKYSTSSDGITWAPAQPVMSTSEVRCNPQLAYDNVNDEVWVVWEEYQSINGDWLIEETTIP